MDGTKPNMDSNAEENQDEGQESKGTPRQHFFFCVFLCPFGDTRACACPSASLGFCLRHHISVLNTLWLDSHIFIEVCKSK